MVDESKAFVVDPGNEFKKALDSISKDIQDLTPPFILITREWFKSNRSIFDMSRKGPGKYPPLGGLRPNEVKIPGGPTNRERAETAKERQVGFAYPLLVRTGKLADSMTNPSSPDSVNMIINKKILILGTKAMSDTGKSNKGYPYPIALQAGAVSKGMYYPRPFVLLGAEQVATPEINKRTQIWLGHIEKHIANVLAKRAK